MNEEEIKSILTFLSQHSSHIDYRDQVTNLKDGTFRTESKGLIRCLGVDRSCDGMCLYIDFAMKKINVPTWLESHHNGDSYDEKNYKIKWEDLHKISKPLNSLFVIASKSVAAAKAIDDAAKVIRDKVLENGGKL